MSPNGDLRPNYLHNYALDTVMKMVNVYDLSPFFYGRGEGGVGKGEGSIQVIA